MIQRVRRPDGSNHDVDHGPGPVGRMSMPGRSSRIHGSPVAQSNEVRMPKLGLTSDRNGRYLAEKRAGR